MRSSLKMEFTASDYSHVLLALRIIRVYAEGGQELSMAEKLNAGGLFPVMSLQIGDEMLTLPQKKDAGYSIILFYRGHW